MRCPICRNARSGVSKETSTPRRSVIEECAFCKSVWKTEDEKQSLIFNAFNTKGIPV